ncbi:poly [ADP-ribose] polymerase tankyrase-2-like isoform X2 [Penaeus vannamei]|uniref:poly [ADP-ribose] polymerase tankyrase-2-like isoform X2 n=1 Tax=Penaeus vannamei TaxID=6689 RepID=UPI00387FAA08
MAVLEVLSRKGARLEETDKDGDTPLHLAASEGHLHVVFLLLSLKVSPKPKNRRGKTPQDVLKKPSETKNSNMEIFRSISQTHIMEKWVESERGRLNLTREMRTQQTSHEEDQKDLQEKLREKDEKVKETQNENAALKDAVAKKDGDLERLKTSLENYRKDMKEKLRDKDKEVEEKEIDIASLKDALAKKEDEISAVKTSLENYQKDMKEKLRDKDKEVEEKEIDIASLKDALAKKEDEISAVKTSHEEDQKDLQEKLREKDEKVKETQNENAALKDAVAKKDGDLERLKTSLENYRKDMKEKLRDKDKEVEEKEIDIASLKDALAKKEDEISEVKTSHEKDQKDLQEKLREKDENVQKTQDENTALKDAVTEKEDVIRSLQRDLAGAGDGQALRSALASLPPRAKKDFLGRHLLHEAAEEGREEVVEILVEAGADVNAKGSEGRTPLHEASSSGQEGVAEILTANGADLNAKTDDGSTPLYLASLNGHVAVVETLARKGADLDEKKSEGFAPLHRAAQYGHVEVIKLLATKGADLNVKNIWGVTPAHSAAYFGQMTALEVLERKGARLEETTTDGGDTPLHLAASEGHLHVVFLLLSLKVSPEPKNRRGETPQDVLKRHSPTPNCNMEIFRDISKTQIMKKWMEIERNRSTCLTREVRMQQSQEDMEEKLREKDAEAVKMKIENASLKVQLGAARQEVSSLEVRLRDKEDFIEDLRNVYRMALTVTDQPAASPLPRSDAGKGISSQASRENRPPQAASARRSPEAEVETEEAFESSKQE